MEMGFEIEVRHSIQDLNTNQWDNIVKQSPLGNCFQQSAWLTALERTLDVEPRHIVAREGHNIIGILPILLSPVDVPNWLPVPETLLPNEVASLPLGYGGPLIQRHEEAVLEEFVKTLDGMGGGTVLASSMTIKDSSYLRYGQHLEANGYHPTLTTCRFIIDLVGSKGELLAAMDSGRRRNLRKATNSAVSVRQRPLSESRLSAFYSAYERAMDRIGAEPYPLDLFQSIATGLGDRAVLLTAVLDGDELGHHLIIDNIEQNTLHFLFSGIEERYFDRYPAELLHDHAIEWGLEEGYSHYDFGDTAADFTDGVFRYKTQYGGRLVPTTKWEKAQSGLWRLYRFGRRQYRKHYVLG